ncbi:MAG TPA: inner membrane-spanning protein YciB [Woeseiaceae bacterium]
MHALFEFLPLILFLGAFLYKDIYFALIVLMVAMPIGLGVKYFRTQKLDKMYFWSTTFLLVAGTLTLYFRNPLFLYWKPTAFYWAVAVAFLCSFWVGEKTLVQRFFGMIGELNLENVTSTQWRRLNIAWIAFFVAAGILNIYVAYNFSEATWVKFKVFGLMALTFVFMIGQTFWLASLINAGGAENKRSK